MSSCKIMTKESLRRKNFAPEEFFVSETAKKLDITNYPPLSEELTILPRLMSTADMMQELRDLLEYPITINSAYRCKILNDAVGSSDRSQHLMGLACDFVCPKFGTPAEVVRFLKSNGFIVDQCFNEGTWIHISRLHKTSDKNRMMYGYYLPDSSGNRKFKAV